MVACVGLVALQLIAWAVSTMQSLPIPPATPAHLYYRRGFFMQGFGSGFVPLLAAASLAVATRLSSRSVRFAVALVGGLAIPALVWGLLIPGYWEFSSPLDPFVLTLVPAITYMLVVRQPRWWLVAFLAYTPLSFLLGSAMLY